MIYTDADRLFYQQYLARLDALRSAAPPVPETRHVGAISEMTTNTNGEQKSRLLKLMASGERLHDLLIPNSQGPASQRWQLMPSGEVVPQHVAEALIQERIMVPAGNQGVYQHKDRVGKLSIGEQQAQAIHEMEQRKHTEQLLAEMKRLDQQKASPAMRNDRGWDAATGYYTPEAVAAARMQRFK